ncbi:MAG TPA: GldG family protein [Burkholderiales bacterium]|nr:GldG family protein [Burkholderiales bacterium]
MIKKYDYLIYSAVGLVALFLVLVAANFLVSRSGLPPLDLTEGKLYTLSAGTKKILQNLQSPVKLKLYASRGESVPVPLRSFSQRVADLVSELRKESRGKLEVEVLDPKPDSEIEDAAQLDGIEPQQLSNGESFYLGAAVTQLDRKQTIPSISPQRERLLEYDLVRAVARVANPERIKIGLMAGLPVLGERFNPYTRQSSEPWVLANELKREFEVKEVPLTAKEIDKDVGVLLLIHPRDIQPETEYALDQFVLRGGKLIAFVDPYAYFDQGPQMPGMPPMPSSSTLPTLFKAWGVEMNPNKVISDVVFGSGGGQRYTPTVLSLNRTAFSRDDVVTASIETLLFAFSGAFDVKPVDGLKSTALIHSSPNSMLVDNADATKSGDEATRRFQPSNKSMPLALRLTGTFKTAFPDGIPADPGSKEKPKPNTGLKESSKENSVILVADVDLLADGAAVDVQEVFGRKIVVPSNGNLALALGMVEQFAAGDELISLRSRTASFRPLTVVRELEAEAQKQYFGKIQALEDELQKTTKKLQDLQKQGAAGASGKGGAQIMTPEQQAELERFRKTVAQSRLELKEVRKNLRQDAESLVFWTKVANIALMPILVALAGLLVYLIRRRRSA